IQLLIFEIFLITEYLMESTLLKPFLFDDTLVKMQRFSNDEVLKKLEKEHLLLCTSSIPSLSLENPFLKDEPSTEMPFPIEPDGFETQPIHIKKSQPEPKAVYVSHFKGNKSIQRRPKLNRFDRKRNLKPKPCHRAVSKKRKRSFAEKPSTDYEELVLDEEMTEDSDEGSDNDDNEYSQKLKFSQKLPEEKKTFMNSSLTDTKLLKEKLLRVIGSVLISQPQFKRTNCAKKLSIEKLCNQVAEKDPEFILKVALYSRRQLNIRSASNYLLAFASMHPKCRIFLKKYYRETIILPTDWIEVADFCAYQTFNKPSVVGVLPVALRKVMVEKFADFDEYQLGKYNRDKKKPFLFDEEHPDRVTRCEFIQKQGGSLYTLKQLVRQLHIASPVKHVMSIIGKKYPETLEQFYQFRLDGTFDENKAGQRMKLAIPETWETQLSLHGNGASTWESLIDNKKLPYMAMLRNIRNLIHAGISPKHTASVLKKLSDEKSVIHSKQLPTQFFSAYAVLNQMEEQMTQTESESKYRKKRKSKPAEYTKEQLDVFRATLDKAMKIATNHNLKPVKGRTIILCNLTDNTECLTARGFDRKPWSKPQAALLLALMCHSSCESCEILLWKQGYKHCVADIKGGTILQNVDKLLNMVEVETSSMETESSFELELEECFNQKLENREHIDTFIMVDNCPVDNVNNFRKLYRQHVNPNMLFVKVNLGETNSSKLFEDTLNNNSLSKDIEIAGFNAQILTFIDSCGDSGQLLHVDNIDKAFNLKASVPKKISTDLMAQPQLGTENIQEDKWKTVQVFISSTFHDMHGERDILTRYVFPKLKHWARKHFIHINEVDLRWGIPKEEEQTSRNLAICLAEAANSDLFLGILGERYGWVPSAEHIPANPDFNWVREYEGQPSITELEMHIATLSRVNAAKDSSFFYFRDSQFSQKVPKKWLKYFVAENSVNDEKMESLKARIKASGFDVCNGYSADWGGIKDGVPLASGLEYFAKRVYKQVKNAVTNLYINNQSDANNLTKSPMKNLHDSFVEKQQQQFIGRKALLDNMLSSIKELSSGVLIIEGKAGCGKSAFLCKLVHECISRQYTEAHNILVNITGVASDSTNILSVLKRFCYQMKHSYNLDTPVPTQYKKILLTFTQMLTQCHLSTNRKILVFIDGLDHFHNIYEPQNLMWLSEVPQGVFFILSVENSGQYHKNLLQRKNVWSFSMPPLVLNERVQIIRNALSTYHKTLSESFFNNQLKVLAWKKEASNPFFLQIACEEMRIFGIFEKVKEKLTSLPETCQGLLENVLVRLEQEIDPDIIKHSLCLLLCSKNGLLTSELFDLLYCCMVYGKYDGYQFQMDEHIPINPHECLPKHKAVRLHYVLHCFLNFGEKYVRSGSLSLNYKQLRTAVQNRYLKNGSEKFYHNILSSYYYKKADCRFDGSWIGKDKQAFALLPFHLISAELFLQLKVVLTNLNFVHSMCMFGLGNMLMQYYSPCFIKDKNMEKMYNAVLCDPEVSDFKEFLQSNLHILNKCPSMMWQQAINGLPSSRVHEKARQVGKMVYIHWNNRPITKDSCSLLIDNLPSKPTCVSLSPDNTLLACGCEDGTAYLFDAVTGNELHNFIGHSDLISSVCFAGNAYLCTGSFDSTLCLWDIKNGFRVSLMKGHTRKVSCCCSDPSQKLIASASWDTTVKIWNSSTGAVICSFAMNRPVNCVAFHPEKALVVTGLWDATLQIWDINKRAAIAVIRGHKTSVRTVAYLPSGTHITSAALDGSVKIWSADHGKQVGNVTGHARAVTAVAYTSNGRQMVTVSEDGKVKIWSSYLGKLLHSLQGKSADAATCVCISPCVTHVAAGYHSGKVRIFHIVTGEKELEYQMHPKSICSIRYSPDGKYLLTGSADTTAKLFTWNNGQCKQIFTKHSQPLLCADVCSSFVVTAAEDITCYLYSLKDTPKSPKQKKWNQLGEHDAPVSTCAFSFDEVFLITAGRDKKVVIWDLKRIWQPHRILYDCHKDWITDCKMSNCGKFVVTCSNDFLLKVWKMNNGTLASTLKGHMAPLNAVCFRKNCVTSACSDGSVKVWSVNGFEVTTLYGHSNRVNGCDMRLEDEAEEINRVQKKRSWTDEEPEKKFTLKKENRITLATCSDDGLVNIWEPLTVQENFCLKGHTDSVLGVSCNNKGTICSCSKDGTLRLWSVPSDSQSTTVIEDHNGAVTGILYSSFNNIIITSGRDGAIKLWDASDISQPKYITTQKLSDYSINSMCFWNNEGTMLATGMDNKIICVWQITPLKNTYIIKKIQEYGLSMPITCVESWPTPSDQTGPGILVSSSLSETMMLHSMTSKELLADSSSMKVLKFSTVKSKNTMLITSISEDQSFLTWEASNSSQEVELNLLIEIEIDNLSPDTYITVVYMTEKFTFFGDSSGQIHWRNNEDNEEEVMETLMIQQNVSITSILVIDEIIITASADNILRVWDMNRIQIAQFYCLSPVMNMTFCQKTQAGDIHFAVGDTLGKMYFLSLKF
ncbi:telomerase protein component 1-like, partial [Argonauta hians]